MIDLHWHSSEYEWVERVHQLLLDLARACLGDIPKLPMHVAQQARPMAEMATRLLDEARHRGIEKTQWYHYPELVWTDETRMLFLELAQVYLSDSPKLPEDTSGRALQLAERAQSLIENAPSEMPETPPDLEGDEAEDPSPSVLLSILKDRLQQQQVGSPNADAPEWQQLFNLLDVAQGLYQRLKR